jgi:hypothetical protein
MGGRGIYSTLEGDKKYMKNFSLKTSRDVMLRDI